MKITKSRLKQIVKEEVEKVLVERQESPIDEGWKEMALAGAMGLSSVGPAPATAAMPPPAATQVMASTKSDLVNRLASFIGRSNRNWLDENYWSGEDVENEPLVAFVEVMEAVKTHWTSTVPNRYMGCKETTGQQSSECAALGKIRQKIDAELVPLMDAANEGQGRSIKKRLAAKLKSAVDKWVPQDKSGSAVKETKIWEDIVGPATFVGDI